MNHFDTKGKEINELIKLNFIVYRADGISARIEHINEESRYYKDFKYENESSDNNVLMIENSLSISHKDYLYIFIDYTKLKKPINAKYTKFKLECDLWSLNKEKKTKLSMFAREKNKYPRFFNNYREYRHFLEDSWKCERIIITEKDLCTFSNLENENNIKVFLMNTGKQSCSCGLMESKVLAILCPKNKIMSFRSKRDYESYYDGEKVFDSHHLNLYLATD